MLAVFGHFWSLLKSAIKTGKGGNFLTRSFALPDMQKDYFCLGTEFMQNKNDYGWISLGDIIDGNFHLSLTLSLETALGATKCVHVLHTDFDCTVVV